MFILHYSGGHIYNTSMRALELLAYDLHLAGRDWCITTTDLDEIIAEWKVGDPTTLLASLLNTTPSKLGVLHKLLEQSRSPTSTSKANTMARVTQVPTGVEVSYPVREAQQIITRAEYDLIDTIENKVQAIKFVKTQYNLGLYEAKQIVDTIKANGISFY